MSPRILRERPSCILDNPHHSFALTSMFIVSALPPLSILIYGWVHGTRTHNLRFRKPTLVPIELLPSFKGTKPEILMEPKEGIEPSSDVYKTPALPLCYIGMVLTIGFEPMTLASSGRCSNTRLSYISIKSGKWGSNP